MFEFLDSYEKRRAFKKALKEVNEEILESRQVASRSPAEQSRATKGGKHTTNHTVTRVYHDMNKDKPTQVSSAQNSFRRSNPLRKPETTAVDLKNFKDWRNISKNESAKKSPTSPILPRSKFPNFDDKPASAGISSTDILAKKSKIDEEVEKDLSIDTFLKRPPSGSSIPVSNTTTDTKKVSDKSSIDSLMKRIEDINKKQAKIKEAEAKIANDSNKVPEENKLKVEVVDFGEKSKETPKKKTNRKPRGKSKKRFDADVIHSVDWK